MVMENHYYILGLKPGATISDIKFAYRKLSLKLYPDQNNGEEIFEEKFKEIQEAYSLLVKHLKQETYSIINHETSGVTCPRCQGKGYIDEHDINRLDRVSFWKKSICLYCKGKR